MKKTTLYTILAALCLAVVAFVFFFPDDMEGNVLQQHDIQQGLANGQEGKAYYEATGEHTRWTNSLFSGMPNFQIAPSYTANVLTGWIFKVYTLGLPSPANLLFAMMLGFFIMCMCMDMKWYTSLFAALAWGFSTYFIIIIGAGHIWKFITLTYIPPTIGGIVLCYRGKYLPATALTALFATLQLMGNHPQMTYYFMLVILVMVIAFLYIAIKNHEMPRWWKATGCAIGAAVLALGANSASLYNTYEYSKQTVRGKATEITAETNSAAQTSGMDRSAITAWSYGTDETFSLLIPNVKGGANAKPVAGQMTALSVAQLDKTGELPLSAEEYYVLQQFPQYFGNQPGTNGPVYVGAFVLLLAILGMFTISGKYESPIKWALFAATVIAIMLSWGHNFEGLTNFMIDYFPGYNKFRAVSSMLVVAEFCIPLLAAMTLRQITDTPDFYKQFKYQTLSVMGGGAFICLLGWLTPSIFGNPFSLHEMEMLTSEGIMTNPQYANIINAIRTSRLSMVSADSLRSLLYIALGCGLLALYFKGVLKNKALFVCALAAVVLIDLFSVNKRYVNTENFTTPTENEESFSMTDADRQILQDTSNYRVLDVAGFSQARSSYFHKTVGGYHAAKLTRYDDLIKYNLLRDNMSYLSQPLAYYAEYGAMPDAREMNVLNMLNVKYIINTPISDSIPVITNGNALGNAWIVGRINYVDTPNAEMASLDTLDTRNAAVADKHFEKILGKASIKAAGDTVYETGYAPNRLNYKVNTARGGIIVFSEVWFPWGWTATIDGKPTDIGRVNYLLRAIRVSAGKHDIKFEFAPKSLETTNTISIVCVILIYILAAAALTITGIKLFGDRKNKLQS